ncbi:uncharacterized protein [Pseudorasbora parva]|uniref:uncharacterized protein n=1 Tax=Pseudorasbora parva TaxID=51549 RepID=UPI00351E538A
MPCVVRCSFLFISICIGSMSCATPVVKVIRDSGGDIVIECATDETLQDGVYMYKQQGAKEPQILFYFYKPKTFTFKRMNESKAIISGEFPKFKITLLNATAEDIGLYWCEFNLEEKTTVGSFTWLWIGKCVLHFIFMSLKEEKEKEREEEEKHCPEDTRVKISFILCAAMSLLCFIGFFCMFLKMKDCRRNRKYIPSIPPSDSVYEEMKRSNLEPSVRTFINPDYQSAKLLR